jgi:predicted nucleic acid-binding protein
VAELLLDTDVFVDHLRGARPIEPRKDAIHFSVITRCELFAGPAEQEEVVRVLLSAFSEVPVDRAVAELAGRLRRETGTLTPDALIAATALERGLTLVTRNVRDFHRVPRLKLREPG